MALFINRAQAQPTAAFDVSEINCRFQKIAFNNESLNFLASEWFFCTPALIESEPFITNLTNATTARSFASAIAKDTTVVVFYANGSLRKASLDNQLLEGPVQLTAINGSSGSFSSQSDFDLVKDDGLWYGFTPNNSSSVALSRSFFGNEIGEELLSFDFINGISPIFNSVSVNIINEHDVKLLLVGKADNGEIKLVEFDESFGSEALSVNSVTIPSAGSILDLVNRKVNGGWEIYAITSGGDNFYKVHFDENFFNPIIETVSVNGGSINSPQELEYIQDNGQEFLALTDGDGDIQIIRWDGLSWVFERSLEATDISLVTFNVTHVDGNTIIVGSTVSGAFAGLNRVFFDLDCATDVITSADTNPIAVYSNEGSEFVTLVVKDEAYNVDAFSQTISILPQTAPPISFSSDNQCIASPNSFNSSNPGLLSYSWDFNGDGTEDSDLENPEFQFPSAGEFVVRLDVDDGTCNNFTTDTIRIFDEPQPDFVIEETNICSNNLLTFTNQSEVFGAEQLATYSWDFDGEGSSAATDTSFTFTTAGVKSVSLTASIPGCENSIVRQVNVNEGPNTNFVFNETCFGEATSFTNLTTGEGIESFFWNFGNGTESTVTSPSITYQQAGEFNVSLTATNDLGCETTETRQLVVNQIPEVGVDIINIPCENDAIVLVDTSSVEAANIVDRVWDFSSFDATPAAIEFSPLGDTAFVTYAASGTFQYSLRVESNFGCFNFMENQIDVSDAPDISFSISNACLSDSVIFQDFSTIGSDNLITERNWLINGEFLSGEQVSVQIDEPGIYTATLTLTSDNLCVVDSTVIFEIPALPNISIAIANNCQGESITLTDNSQSVSDPIISRQWIIGSLGTSTAQSVSFVPSDSGQIPVTLILNTENGCTTDSTFTLSVDPAPVADFTTDLFRGGAPLTATFQNLSSGATQFSWDFEVGTSVEEEPTFIFTETGNFNVTLAAINDFGCIDTVVRSITVEEPELNLDLVSVIENTNQVGEQSFVLLTENSGNVIPDAVSVSIDFDNQFRLTENLPFNRTLPGERRVDTLQLSLPPQSTSGLNFVCFNLNAVKDTLTESNLQSNEACVPFNGNTSVLKVSPNPAKDFINVSVIGEQQETARVIISNINGGIVFESTVNTLQQGLNVFSVELTALLPGMYFLSVETGGGRNTQRFIKN